MHPRILICTALFLALSWSAPAETVVLFDADQAGPDVWSWSGARVDAQGDKLVITEFNKQGDYGDAFVDVRLPYLEQGFIEFEVEEVRSGAYTFQVMAFKGDSGQGHVDVLKESTNTGNQRFTLADLDLPPGTEQVVFKVWAVNEEGATLVLDTLKYGLEVESIHLERDEKLSRKGNWTEENIVVQPTPGGVALSVPPDKNYSALILDDRSAVGRDHTVLAKFGDVEGGTVSVQLVCFDRKGTYLKSVDVAKEVRNGWHGLALNNTPWPEGATHAAVKVWLGGGSGAKATLERLLIVKP